MIGTKLFTASLLTLALGVMVSSTNAAIVFSDDFEMTISNAATYTVANTSQKEDTAKWVGSAQGFNASHSGIVNENRTGESFTDPTGSQAWAGRYTSNTGVSTKEGVIGTLAAGQTITVTFDAVTDGTNSGDDINAYLVLYNSGAAGRDDFRSPIVGTSAVLAQLTQNNVTTTSYQTFQITYTVGDAVVDNNGAAAGVATTWLDSLLGKDIALRFEHKTDAIIDNVSVDITTPAIPEPATLALFGLGGLMMIKRRPHA